MPRHPTRLNGLRLASRFMRIVRALGLGPVAPSVQNAGKRLRHARAALRRIAIGKA